MTGRIFDIQRFSIGNGPGIRTTVFLKGCSLRCQWCHNPESFLAVPQLKVNLRLCRHCGKCAVACKHGVHTLTGGTHQINIQNCALCGDCIDACCFDCISIIGKDFTAQQLADIILADTAYYEKSGGGVTFSGGEPMLQFDFIREVIALLGTVSVYIDTSGNCSDSVFYKMLPLVQGILFDIKHIDPILHKKLTGGDNAQILQNLRAAANSDVNLTIRYPMIPGMNDDDTTIAGICELLKDLGIHHMDVSPYHDYGNKKYFDLAMTAPQFQKYTSAQEEERLSFIRSCGIEPTVI